MHRIQWSRWAALAIFAATITGCQPKTPAQKAEDKMEDAGHEMGQAAERAGERVNDATH